MTFPDKWWQSLLLQLLSELKLQEMNTCTVISCQTFLFSLAPRFLPLPHKDLLKLRFCKNSTFYFLCCY